jgi:hypothetical protein
VRLWTTRRLPFTTHQSDEQRHMVARVVPRLAHLKGEPGERLEAIFMSGDRLGGQPDAENITLYNFGTAGFRFAPAAISFERSFDPPPPPPEDLDGDARFYHRWAIVRDQRPLSTWQVADPVARWDDVPLLWRGNFGIDTWLSLREQPERTHVDGEIPAREPFGIVVDLTAPPRIRLTPELLKGVVDGGVAAFQRADELDNPVIARLLRRGWARPMTADRLIDLATAAEPKPVFPRPPFNRNGLDPCDESCVAGLVRLRPGDGLTMTGYLARVEPL